jgi:hypothetical protein
MGLLESELLVARHALTQSSSFAPTFRFFRAAKFSVSLEGVVNSYIHIFIYIYYIHQWCMVYGVRVKVSSWYFWSAKTLEPLVSKQMVPDWFQRHQTMPITFHTHIYIWMNIYTHYFIILSPMWNHVPMYALTLPGQLTVWHPPQVPRLSSEPGPLGPLRWC